MSIKVISDSDNEFSMLLSRVNQFASPAELQDLTRLIAERIGNEATRLARESYPPAPGRPLDRVYPRTDSRGRQYLSKFKTVKQQRFFFYALAKGLIKVPYSRRGGAGLGGSFTYETALNAGVSATITVGTNKPYAPFVIGSPRQPGPYTYPALQQTYYHQKSGWVPLITQMENNVPEFRAIIIDMLKTAIRAYLITQR